MTDNFSIHNHTVAEERIENKFFRWTREFYELTPKIADSPFIRDRTNSFILRLVHWQNSPIVWARRTVHKHTSKVTDNPFSYERTMFHEYIKRLKIFKLDRHTYDLTVSLSRDWKNRLQEVQKFVFLFASTIANNDIKIKRTNVLDYLRI